MTVELDARIAELMDIIRGFIRLRSRLRPVLPEELARAKGHLAAMLPRGKDWNPHDFELFFSVGVMLIRQGEPMTMGELSQSLDVPLSTATRIMDQLVKHGYAQRLPDPADRRIVRVALTDTGTQMYRGIQGMIESRLRHLLGHFTNDEQETFLALLRKLHNAIKEEGAALSG
jgi:DNA-binding MarR family transcriptional regulator